MDKYMDLQKKCDLHAHAKHPIGVELEPDDLVHRH